ncbi:MAG: organic solvent tolerance protein OstA [Candidatus Midichloriaceae bacterium]|jgi:LPS-assembly protein|nr:organic solvent tolerance protein OstA [Candidatus Midichloriaceae bacterium]
MKVVFVFILMLLAAPAFAKSTFEVKNSNSPIDVVADKLYYDKDKDLIYGTGNVVITQDNQIIIADEISYYKDIEEVYAHGNISLVREDGSVYFGDKARINRAKDMGLITNFKGRFGKHSLVAAGYAEMVSENLMELNEMVYSPCTVCEANFFPDFPLWQFRSAKAELNREEERIYYTYAKLDAFGFPIFYTPYLSTPAPGAKNKSGFLIPRVINSQILGTSVRVPYYQVIAPNMDATLGVQFNSQVGNLYDLEFRHKLKQGEYKIFSSITHTEKYKKDGGAVPGKKDNRGHYDIAGKYYFNKPYLFGVFTLDSKRVMDPTKTYTKKYGFTQEDLLKTDAHFRNVSHNSYYSVRSLFFQDLRPVTSAKTTAAALPQATYMYDTTVKALGAKAEILADYTNLSRPQGMNYNRFVSIASLDKNHITKFGLIWKNQVSARGDLYNVDFKPVKVDKTASNYTPFAKRSGTDGRFHPEFTTSLNMPLYKVMYGNFVTIDPIVQLIMSPKQSNLKIVDNEDSQAPEISTSNLFSANRYKGYDLMESGNRANYGVRSSIKSSYFNDLSLVLGQSHRFDKDRNFDKASGMLGYRSDYVSKVSLTLNPNVQISNGTRFDNKNFSVNRNEFGTTYSDANHIFSLYHFMINKNMLDEARRNTSYRQEIQVNAGYKFYREWWVDTFIKTKLGKKPQVKSTRMISDGISIRNFNECLSLQIGVQRDYTTLKDLKPSTSYIFNISIPTF